jgi:hypothetical protein
MKLGKKVQRGRRGFVKDLDWVVDVYYLEVDVESSYRPSLALDHAGMRGGARIDHS